MTTQTHNILALDIGMKRIGVARANSIARIASPLTTLDNDELFVERLQALIREEDITVIVAGLPRNMSGDDTDQTRYVRTFVSSLEQALGMKITFQDEALTSVQAEKLLRQSKKGYQKADIDAAAAATILDDFLREHAG